MTGISTNTLNLLGGLLAVLGAVAIVVLDSPIAAAVLFVLAALVFLQAVRSSRPR